MFTLKLSLTCNSYVLRISVCISRRTDPAVPAKCRPFAGEKPNLLGVESLLFTIRHNRVEIDVTTTEISSRRCRWRLLLESVRIP